MVALASSAPAASPEKPLETTNFTSNPAVVLIPREPVKAQVGQFSVRRVYLLESRVERGSVS